MGKGKKRFLQVMVTLVLLAIGMVGMQKITASRQKIKRHKPPAPVPVVRIMEVKTGPHRLVIRGDGTVQPLDEIRLIPQVGGRVIYTSPALIKGGRFIKDEILLSIDPVDYQLALILARAKVKDGESRLKIAEEESAAAREEWRLNHDTGDHPEPPPLVAKKPQLAAARAMLEAYRADLKKARLNLERTKLKAPFDGRVSREDVGLSQYVSPGQILAILYSIEAAEIVVPLEDRDAFWFHIPGFTPGTGSGAPATVTARTAGRIVSWSGRVVRTGGKIDEQTRLLPVVVRVKRPYAKKPPLAVGLFVSVDIHGRTLSGISLIPRSAIHQGGIVWVVEDNTRLQFHPVKIARYQGDTALVSAGLKNGDQVVISPMEAVTDGMAVRPIKEKEHDLP